MFEFVFSNCKTYKEIATAVTRHSKDIAVLSQKFGVAVIMGYDKARDELRIGCRGKDPIACSVIFISIMSAAIILGVRQDRDWKPIMAEAWALSAKNPDRFEALLRQFSTLQLELSQMIRLEKKKKKVPSFNLHTEFAS